MSDWTLTGSDLKGFKSFISWGGSPFVRDWVDASLITNQYESVVRYYIPRVYLIVFHLSDLVGMKFVCLYGIDNFVRLYIDIDIDIDYISPLASEFYFYI